MTGRPASAASANTMPKPSTSRPPQRLRQGEANTSAARSHSFIVVSASAPVRCTRSPTPALLGAVVETRRQPALADDDEVQARELLAQQAQGVDELVLALARHEAADADDELAVDAETLAQARGLVAVRPARTRRR